MSNPFNSESRLKLKSCGCRSGNCLDFMIYQGNIECSLWSDDNGKTWYGGYINSDGWRDMSAKRAYVAAKMYGCIDMIIPIGETINFDRPDVSDKEFDYAYGFSNEYPY